MTELNLTTIEFNGATLIARRGETPEQTLVAMKPVAEGMGLAWTGQLQKIKDHPILSKGMKEFFIPSAGGTQAVTALPLTRLNFWLATIQPNKIPNAETRARVIAYQERCADVLFAHFFGQAARRAEPAMPTAPRPAAPPEVGLASRFVAAREVSAWSRYLNTVSQIFGPHVAAAQYGKTPLPPIDPAMLAEHEVDVPELDGVACLAHLLTIRVSRSTVTLGHLIARARTDRTTRNSLADIGIAPAPQGYEGYVAIATDHPRLTRLFVGTDWATNWELALLSLPGARPGHEVGQAFARKRRAVLLPWTLFGADAVAARPVLQ